MDSRSQDTQQSLGWDELHARYVCVDDAPVLPPRKTSSLILMASIDERARPKMAFRSEEFARKYCQKRPLARALASGLLLSRDMRLLLGYQNRPRILAFPRSVCAAPPLVLKNAPGVRSLLLGEGIRALTGEFRANSEYGQRAVGIFQEADVKSVRLPTTLKHIGAAAFQHCWGIARIVLPEGLERLGPACFADSCVKTLELPRSIVRVDPDALGNQRAELRFAPGTEVIRQNVLRGCKCGTVAVPESVREIREGAFARAEMKHVDFGFKSGLECICADAFRGSAIESLMLPSSVVVIGDSAFRDCHDLRRVNVLSDSVLVEIGAEAFRDTRIREFLAPATLLVVGNAAFMGCSDLEKARLNDGLQVLGFRCFDAELIRKVEMSKLQRATWAWKLGDWMHVRELALPDGLERVGEQWLYWSEAERVSVPRSVKVLEKSAFESSHLREIVFSTDSLLREIGQDCFCKTHIQCITVPGTVERIGDGAFRGCATLKRVTFQSPSGLERIGERAFAETSIKEFAAPSSLKEIGAGVFQDCKKLKQAILNIGLETLGDFAFCNCPLSTFNFPSTLLAVGESAFSGCRKIKKVHLQVGVLAVEFDKKANCPRSRLAVSADVQEIGFSRAYQLFGLQKVVFQKRSQAQRLCPGAFMGSALREFKGIPSLGDVQPMAFFGCKELVRVELARVPETIEEMLFTGTQVREVLLPGKQSFSFTQPSSEIKEVVLPEGLQTITANSFKQWKLRRAMVPGTVRVIQRGAFEECQCLTEVTFVGDSLLEVIGENSFRGSGLESFTVPGRVRNIMARAFCDCKSLGTIILSQGLEVLGEESLSRTALEYAVVPMSLREIANGAFYGCHMLRSLVFEDGSQLKKVGLHTFGDTPLDICDAQFPAGADVNEKTFAERM